MIAFGSGDPTRAICSSLIAHALLSLRYPILPEVHDVKARQGATNARREILHIRHQSLYTPRDFDLSPYFQIVKPFLVQGFGHHGLLWDDGRPELSAPQRDGSKAAEPDTQGRHKADPAEIP